MEGDKEGVEMWWAEEAEASTWENLGVSRSYHPPGVGGT